MDGLGLRQKLESWLTDRELSKFGARIRCRVSHQDAEYFKQYLPTLESYNITTDTLYQIVPDASVADDEPQFSFLSTQV